MHVVQRGMLAPRLPVCTNAPVTLCSAERAALWELVKAGAHLGTRSLCFRQSSKEVEEVQLLWAPLLAPLRKGALCRACFWFLQTYNPSRAGPSVWILTQTLWL